MFKLIKRASDENKEVISLNFSSASSSPGFLSGWYSRFPDFKFSERFFGFYEQQKCLESEFAEGSLDLFLIRVSWCWAGLNIPKIL